MKPLSLFAGFVLAVIGGVWAIFAGFDRAIVTTIFITLLTASWWVTEAMPIPATSLVPFALFPLAGILTHKEAASALGSHVIILLMASFMLSKALEKSALHERLALYMIRLVGVSGRRLVLGFMVAAAILSMWISNSATTLMLATLALAIIARDDNPRLSVPLLLGIAYAASLGGTATLIGTPPNLIFADAFEQVTQAEYSFARFMVTGLPGVVIGVPVMALWLTRSLGGVRVPVLPEPGPWRPAEVRTMLVFGLAIILWITRAEPFGGWSGVFGITGAGDSTVAVFAVVLMFLVPSGNQAGDGRTSGLLDWESASDIPWGLLLLFAGGICIAAGFRASGLDGVIGRSLAGLASLPPFLMIIGLCLSVTFLTEMTSNTATANLLMPVLAAVAVEAQIAPALIMIPAVISASCAFMLPVATAPNAIVYGTGKVTIGRMVREGFVLNIIIALIVATSAYFTLSPANG
ncbi:MAG: SLC13 family permease [Pseudomonadota bacterium]